MGEQDKATGDGGSFMWWAKRKRRKDRPVLDFWEFVGVQVRY